MSEIHIDLTEDEKMFCMCSKIHRFSRYNSSDINGNRYYDIISKLYDTRTISTDDLDFLGRYLKENTPKNSRYRDKWWYANFICKKLKNIKKDMEE